MSLISPKSQEKQLTPDELQSVKQLKNDYANLALSLGEIELQKISLEKEKERLSQAYVQLNNKEADLVKILTDKYGKGSIDTETGIVK